MISIGRGVNFFELFRALVLEKKSSFTMGLSSTSPDGGRDLNVVLVPNYVDKD